MPATRLAARSPMMPLARSRLRPATGPATEPLRARAAGAGGDKSKVVILDTFLSMYQKFQPFLHNYEHNPAAQGKIATPPQPAP